MVRDQVIIVRDQTLIVLEITLIVLDQAFMVDMNLHAISDLQQESLTMTTFL
jgi:hypothetical protein